MARKRTGSSGRYPAGPLQDLDVSHPQTSSDVLSQAGFNSSKAGCCAQLQGLQHLYLRKTGYVHMNMSSRARDVRAEPVETTASSHWQAKTSSNPVRSWHDPT